MFPVSGAEQLQRLRGRCGERAHDLGQRGVVEVGEAVGPLGLVGEEEVPEPAPRASVLSSSITGGWWVRVARLGDLLVVHGLGRVHVARP